MNEDIDESDIVELPRIRISQDCIKKIRNLTGNRLPILRPSIQKVIEPTKLEEAVIASVVKHFSLKEVINNISTHEQEMSTEYFVLIDIMAETYQKLNGLIRILQQIAELENLWHDDVRELKGKKFTINEAFFSNYSHDESKIRILALLSFLKDVDFDPQISQKSVDDLKVKLEYEANMVDTNTENLSITKNIVKAIIQRIDLLLKVTILEKFEINQSDTMSRSLQNWPSTGNKNMKMTVDQAFDDSILQIPKLQLKMKIRKMNNTFNQESYQGRNEKSPHSKLLEQLFEFIGSHPEKAVSTLEFIEAAKMRKMRGMCRTQALTIMKNLLQLSEMNGSGSFLMNSICFIIQNGPKTDDLTCGGMESQVQDLFSDLLTDVVSRSSQNIFHCKTSICILCIIPYRRMEESSLVKSGLVNLLDKLCGLNHDKKLVETNSDDLTSQQELSLLAWAGFKVLANRCIKWQENSESPEEDVFQLRLPQQVSILLTNNLNRAKNASIETSNYEGLQEILTLLNTLAESKMGQDILSQPTCVSKLLSLLLEPKLSPRMIQTIVQLCHVALPLLSHESFNQVEVPIWSLGEENVCPAEDKPCKSMVKLLLAKIADYIVPGYQIKALTQKTIFEKLEEVKEKIDENFNEEDALIPHDIPDMDRTMSLYLYKREDEPAHDVIQHLLNASAELRLFRMTESQNMEKIVKMDKDLNKFNKTEVTTDDATVILRRAIKLAQQGFVVSVGLPQRNEEFSEEKKSAVEQVAKERNASLMKHDPVRPFISSSVSNNLASDLIVLIHTLFTSKTADFWVEAIHETFTSTLKSLRRVAESKDLLSADNQSDIFDVYSEGRKILAVLATLGGYRETLKPGLEVSIIGNDIENCIAEIVSIVESAGTATVKLIVPENQTHYPRPSNVLQVPLDRLKARKKMNPVTLFMPIAPALIDSLQSAILPDPSGADPMSVPLPSQGDGRSLKLSTARLIAEIRTRSSEVLALYLQDSEFACRFLQNSCQAVDMLKCFSKECLPADRSETVTASTERLRNIYRDCVKPPAPPSRRQNSKHKMMVWDPSKTFPPLKSLLFSHNMNGITYYGDPGNSTGQPRGLLIYANQMIPSHVNNFYWELDIISLGDTPDDSGSPVISVGFAPMAEKKEGTWSNPVGTMFFHNNGRVVHYNGQSLLQWRSLRFEVQLNPGDTLGIGWEKLFEVSNTAPASGRVYFTLNGEKLDQALEYVNGNMYPVVHIQKKNVRVKANFGSNKFRYADGRILQSKSAELATSSKDITDEELSSMPFQGSNQSSGSSSPEIFDVGAGHRRYISYSSRTALCPKALKEYSPSCDEDFRSEPCHEPGTTTGSHIQPITLLDSDSDSEDESEDGDNTLNQHDDINCLLVKSWETKVFPIIRRRFRNETERRDGLEQIKGALSLGMADIARQTVEFLYEENGGIPRDLHLPTLEDIKEELNKFSIDRIRKGQAVVISSHSDLDLTSMPKYCVPMMLKTFGLIGEVLEIDNTNELVQVETYLRLEGTLVRFWYPLNVLEKPQDCSKKTAVTGAQVVNINNSLVHRELLSWEFANTRLNCRTAYVTLIEQSRNEDLPTYVCVEENSSMATMIRSSILLFQDIDIENLQYISNSLLATPPNGNMMERNLSITSSENVLNLANGKMSDLFYHDTSQLREGINDYISKAGLKGEDYLIELSNQICVAIQHAPELFTTEEIGINDTSMLKSSIHFPKAAFVTASVKMKREIKDIKDLKDLAIQIQTVDGTFVKPNGHISSRDIIQYPMEVTGFKEPLNSVFLPVVMATDLVRVSHSGGEDMGFKLLLHSVPQEFPLAVIFLEEIVNRVQKDAFVTSGAIKNLIVVIAAFLVHMDVAQIIKERMLLLLSELVRIHHQLESKSVSTQVFAKLKEELKMLYEFETSQNKFLKFSTYFQSLFEISTAIRETTEELTDTNSKDSRSTTPTVYDREESPGFGSTLFKRRCRLDSRRSTSPILTSEEKIHSNDPSWYSKANEQIQLLKYFVDRKNSCKTLKQVKHIYQNLQGPNDYSRLLIVKGLPRHLNEEQLKSEIHQALNHFGGLYKNEIFIIPVTEIENMKPAVDEEDTLVVENIEFETENDLGDDNDSVTLEHRQRTESFAEPVTPVNSGMAVIKARAKVTFGKCREELESNSSLNIRGEFDTDGSVLSTSAVLPTMRAEDPFMDKILELYLRSKLFTDENGTLHQDCYNALEDIFLSCYMANQRENIMENADNDDVITLQFSQILRQVEDNMMYTFLYGIKQSRGGLLEGVREILQQYGQPCKVQNTTPLTPPRKNRLSSSKDGSETLFIIDENEKVFVAFFL